jgi:hypothetical protein
VWGSPSPHWVQRHWLGASMVSRALFYQLPLWLLWAGPGNLQKEWALAGARSVNSDSSRGQGWGKFSVLCLVEGV